MKSKNDKKPKIFSNEIIEAGRSIGNDVVHSVKDDLAEASINKAWKTLLGKDYDDSKKHPKTSGDLKAGEELSLESIKKRTESLSEVVPAIDYRKEVLKTERRVKSENQQEIRIKIEEVLIEIKKLIKSSSELRIEFKEVETEEIVENPGKYHLNFLEWLFITIKMAREKVEESSSWLEAFYSKRSKKKYWNMFKKHGTTFGQSQERSVSTQTG